MTPPKAKPEANLGCATTRELLEEVSARMRADTSGKSAAKTIGTKCYEAIFDLPPETLEYRTVDS